MSSKKKKLKIEDIAFVFDVSRQTIYNWQSEGKIPDGDYDLEKLEKAISQVSEDRLNEARQEVEKIQGRFRFFEAGPLAVAA